MFHFQNKKQTNISNESINLGVTSSGSNANAQGQLGGNLRLRFKKLLEFLQGDWIPRHWKVVLSVSKVLCWLLLLYAHVISTIYIYYVVMNVYIIYCSYFILMILVVVVVLLLFLLMLLLFVMVMLVLSVCRIVRNQIQGGNKKLRYSKVLFAWCCFNT